PQLFRLKGKAWSTGSGTGPGVPSGAGGDVRARKGNILRICRYEPAPQGSCRGHRRLPPSTIRAAPPAPGAHCRPGGRKRASDPTPDRGHRIASRGRKSCEPAVPRISRSEEHTSELQSRENLVCRVLLEK